MTPTAQYPKRPPFFAYRFTRLLCKACVANDLGTDAVLLLIAVAHQEDAKKYSGAVSYWNTQIMPLIGCRSESTFKRIRARCVEAGWLHYDAGAKSRAAVYWVTVPKTHTHWNDSPTDEDRAEYGPDSGSDLTGNKAGYSGSPVVQNADRMRTECGPESGRNADGMWPPSVPVPDPKESDASHLSDPAPPAAGPPAPPPPAKGKKPRKEPTGPHHESIRRFCGLWREKYPGEGEYPFAGGKDADTVAWALKRCGDDPERLAAVFARFLADDDVFYAAGEGHPLAKLRQHFTRWFVSTPTHQRSPPGTRPATKAEAMDHYAAEQAASVFEG